MYPKLYLLSAFSVFYSMIFDFCCPTIPLSIKLMLEYSGSNNKIPKQSKSIRTKRFNRTGNMSCDCFWLLMLLTNSTTKRTPTHHLTCIIKLVVSFQNWSSTTIWARTFLFICRHLSFTSSFSSSFSFFSFSCPSHTSPPVHAPVQVLLLRQTSSASPSVSSPAHLSARRSSSPPLLTSPP